jgi:hypothetical protein
VPIFIGGGAPNFAMLHDLADKVQRASRTFGLTFISDLNAEIALPVQPFALSVATAARDWSDIRPSVPVRSGIAVERRRSRLFLRLTRSWFDERDRLSS